MAGRRIADLLVKIGADSYEFQQAADKVEKSIGKFSKKVESVGKQLSLKLTAPLAAFAGLSVKLADTQVQAEQKLLHAIKGRADMQQRLIQQAADLQERSTLGDEAIIAQQSYLASLKLTEQQVKDTTEASVQLSYATGMTLESAVKNLAKTYGGLTGELGESLPALKNFTKEQLQSGAAVDFVLKSYKGYAEVAASSGIGPLLQLKNAWGDFMEQIGSVIIPYLQKAAVALMSIVKWLQSLSPETRSFVVVIGGLAAAIGPLLVTFGGIVKMLPMLAVGMSALFSPITLITAAVVALGAAFFYARQQKQEMLDGMTDRFSNLTTTQLQEKLEDNKRRQEVNDNESPFQGGSIASRVTYAVNKPKRTRELKMEEEAITEAIKRRTEAQQAQNQVDEAAKKVTEDMQEALADLKSGGTEPGSIIGSLKKQIDDLEKKKLLPANSVDDIARINVKLEKTKRELEAISNAKPDPSGLGQPISGSIQTVGFGVKPVDINPETVVKPIDHAMDAINKRMAEITLSFRQNVSDLFSNAVPELMAGISESIGQMIAGDLGFGGLLAGIGMQIGNFMKRLGQMVIQYATQMMLFKKALSFIVKNPLLALGVGAALVVAGSAIVSKLQKAAQDKAPRLARGGLAYGPTYAMIGDNPNASVDPEVVAPLSKLQSMIGNNGGRIDLCISGWLKAKGHDLEIVLSRNNFRTKLVNG